jgi:phospholipase C
VYDPSDIPFEYYPQFNDNAAYMKDFDDFASDVAASRLPNLAFIKAIGYLTEHPGVGTTISDGVAFVDSVVQKVLSSPYADSTLVLLAWDEGGGFFDHVPPPAANPVDGEDYGTRLPFLAIGRFARRNFVSHVPMEHSSVVRFLEWNFLGATGQLQARDATVNGIGSLLDPAEIGVAIAD